MKELQALAQDVRVLDENGEEIELSKLGEEEPEFQNRPYREQVTAEDVGETVAPENVYDTFSSEDFGGQADAEGIFYAEGTEDGDDAF